MAKDTKTENTKSEKKGSKKNYIQAVGRRKEAVARVRLYTHIADAVVWGPHTLKKSQIFVNQKPIEQYFPGPREKVQFSEPLRVVNALDRYIATIVVSGGGHAGQLQAVIHGLARALEKADKEKHRPILKKKGFLTRDARAKQRRNVGMGGKSRRKKQSPKR